MGTCLACTRPLITSPGSEIPGIQCLILKIYLSKEKNNNTHIPLGNTNKGIILMFEYNNIYTVP